MLTFITMAQQTPINTGRINLITSNERFQYINPFDGRDVPIRGERFLNDSVFRPGELKTLNNLYTTELTYRFDQIERTIQIKMENSKQFYLFEKDIEYCKILIDNKTLMFIPTAVPNGRKLTLLQVIYKSPTLQLYRDIRKFVFRVKSDNIDGYSSEEVYDDIRKDYRYYLRKGETNNFTEVKIDVKSFVNVLPDKRSQIVKLFKAGKANDGLSVSKLAQIMAEIDKPVEEKKEEATKDN